MPVGTWGSTSAKCSRVEGFRVINFKPLEVHCVVHVTILSIPSLTATILIFRKRVLTALFCLPWILFGVTTCMPWILCGVTTHLPWTLCGVTTYLPWSTYHTFNSTGIEQVHARFFEPNIVAIHAFRSNEVFCNNFPGIRLDVVMSHLLPFLLERTKHANVKWLGVVATMWW